MSILERDVAEYICNGTVTYRKGTLFAGIFSMVFSAMIFIFEIALEGGFDMRNYVILAFCIVWILVAVLLIIGAYKQAHFILLPWIILTSSLVPLLLIAVVTGSIAIGRCAQYGENKHCLHELHMFGTNHHPNASIKLSIFVVMTTIGVCGLLVVYKYYSLLSLKTIADQAIRQLEDPVQWEKIRRKPDMDIFKTSCRKYRGRLFSIPKATDHLLLENEEMMTP